MKAKEIDFGIIKRPDGTVSRLIMSVAMNGQFSIYSMVTPHEGTIVATGLFREYIRGVPDLAVERIAMHEELVAALERASFLLRRIVEGDHKALQNAETAAEDFETVIAKLEGGAE